MGLHLGNKLPYPAIRAIGIASIVCVAGLTGFTVKLAIDDANNRANGAYADALANVQIPDQQLPTDDLAAEEPVTEEPVTEPPVTNDDPEKEEPVIEEPEKEEETPTDDQNPDRVDETPEDLGYDLTHVSVDDKDVVIYTIQPGDWLSRIGSAYGFTVQELSAANPYIKNVDLIFSGDPVVLPGDADFVAYVKYYKDIAAHADSKTANAEATDDKTKTEASAEQLTEEQHES